MILTLFKVDEYGHVEGDTPAEQEVVFINNPILNVVASKTTERVTPTCQVAMMTEIAARGPISCGKYFTYSKKCSLSCNYVFE